MLLDVLAAATGTTGADITRVASIVAAVSASFVAILNSINTRRSTSYTQLLKDIKEALRDVTRDELEDLEKALERLTEAVDRVTDRRRR